MAHLPRGTEKSGPAVGANRGGEISSELSARTDELISVAIKPRPNAPIAILTGEYGARVLRPLIDSLERNDVRILEVANNFFGGNIKVSGLMVGEDVRQVLEREPHGHQYLLPDVCLNNGRFLDGLQPSDLPKHVEVIPTNGVALRAALETRGSTHQFSEELAP